MGLERGAKQFYGATRICSVPDLNYQDSHREAGASMESRRKEGILFMERVGHLDEELKDRQSRTFEERESIVL